MITKEMIALLDFISPNETELERLFEDNQIDKKVGIEALFEINPKLHILLKLGKEGC